MGTSQNHLPLDIAAISADAENNRILRLHFNKPVTAADRADLVAAINSGTLKPDEVTIPTSDADDLDAVIRELGIEDSFTTPAEAVQALKAERDALMQDGRWAINVLLETIAKKFEAYDTWDIWRSDAASLVRSFKRDLATRPADCIASSEWPLVVRLHECASRIGRMCSEGRPPRMSIPARADDDDIFIARTCREAADVLTATKPDVRTTEKL